MSEPWRSWLAVAVTRFAMSPAVFWALTLAEWRALTLSAQSPRPMTRAELQALILAHGEPDEKDPA